MKFTTKRRKEILNKVNFNKEYSINEAVDIIKNLKALNFDETIEIAINLGVDPRHADQNIRVTSSLPNGSGKKVKILVLSNESDIKKSIDAGADYAGNDDFLQKLESGWSDIDTIVAHPSIMPKLGKLGKILGPKGLMPNPKSGTVSSNVVNSVKDIKSGRIELRVDKNGIVHAPIGKKSFSSKHLVENYNSVLKTISGSKPPSFKGTFLKKITISSTMGPGLKIERVVV